MTTQLDHDLMAIHLAETNSDHYRGLIRENASLSNEVSRAYALCLCLFVALVLAVATIFQ